MDLKRNFSVKLIGYNLKWLLNGSFTTYRKTHTYFKWILNGHFTFKLKSLKP